MRRAAFPADERRKENNNRTSIVSLKAVNTAPYGLRSIAMPGTRGGSHVKAGRQSHKNEGFALAKVREAVLAATGA